MQSQSHSSERGQAILLVVLAMVVLLGFAALAVDGSMVYSDRRYAQSAADASSLAGGHQAATALEASGIDYMTWTANPPNCTGEVEKAGKVGRDAAIKRAKTNNFTIDTNFDDNMGVETSCGIYEIFAINSEGKKVKLFSDKYMDIETRISQQTDTAFAHFIYRGEMVNTVSSVTRVHPRQPLAYGFAIVALNENACSGNKYGVQFRGSSKVEITGGGVFSNGCLDVDGNKVSVTINHGRVMYFDTANKDDTGKIVFNPSTGKPTQLTNLTDRIPASTYDVAPPNCDGHWISADNFINYSKDHPTAPAIPSGLYCIDGDLKITNAKDNVNAVGVTLYVKGDLDLSGGTVILKAPPKNYVGPAIPGVVLYAPKSNTNSWKINGNSTFLMQGTVLATGATIDIVGNSLTNGYMTQIIASNVNIGGNSDTAILYCDCQNAMRPTTIDVQR